MIYLMSPITLTINLYPDNTTIYVTDYDPDTLSFKPSKDLQKIAEWIDMNGLNNNCWKDTINGTE